MISAACELACWAFVAAGVAVAVGIVTAGRYSRGQTLRQSVVTDLIPLGRVSHNNPIDNA